VGLLLDNDDDIAGLSTWELVGLPVEGVMLAIGRTLVNLSIDDFLFFVDLLAIANLALVLLIDDFSFSTTIVARTLGLSVHTGSELLHFGNHAATSASSALLDGAFLTAFTAAGLANTLAIDSDLSLFAHVDFL
jgi:hypothetical protein